MADQDSLQTKENNGQPSISEAKFLVGRFGNINLDDDIDEADASEESLSLTKYSNKNQNNAEGIIRYLMEKKKQENEILELDLAPYKQLWKAISCEHWKEVRKELNRNPLALTSPITEFYETILHILVNSEKALWLVREIVDKIDSDSLGKTDYQHDTALSIAAYVGNMKAAKMMALKNPDLLTRCNYSGDSPFHAAARFGHVETFRCLLTVARTTQIDDQSFFSGENGAMMIQYLISANLYGLALYLLKCYPKLGRENLRQRKRILKELAEKPLGFKSGCKFGFWERLIYKGISVTKEVTVPSIETKDDDSLRIDIVDRDKENPTNGDFFARCREQAYSIIGFVFPRFKRIHQTKLMNEQARQLVKSMCSGVLWTFPKASYALKLAVLKAASLGIQEIVEEILKEYTAATMFYDDDNYNIFQLAVLHRREKVFKLIYKTGLSQKWVASYPCKNKENILHLAGKCIPTRHINGAALQMQWETQWFKEGEKWMRDTAKSCMVVDTLIIAMVFAAIIAVPGNNEKGIPNFRNETLFKVFIIADAAALFSSSFSLLLFVRILTSRYAEEDFLKTLPRRLLLGLMTLIFSVATMLVASCSALIMLIDAVPGPKPKVMLRKSTVVPVTIMAALPVVFFVFSLSHLLIDVLLSTYRPAIRRY
ncbi:hypothetical protein REPUB_Repub20aG0023000 [Reevesia pubescens]